MADPSRTRSRRRLVSRLLMVLAALGVVALIVVLALPKPIPVDVAAATRGPLRVTVDEDGMTRVKDRYVISAPLTGSVARVALSPGDAVKEGDVVARLVPVAPPLLDERARLTAEARLAGAMAAQKQARAEVERLAAQHDLAKSNAERVQKLESTGSVAREAYEQALTEARTASATAVSSRFGARVADYEVEVARASLGHLGRKSASVGGRLDEQLPVRSPVEGAVLKVFQKSEGVLQAGAPIVEVGDSRALEIAVDVLTSDAVRIKPGAAAVLERWGGTPLDARVRTVEPSAFTRTSALGVDEQRVNVVLDLTSPIEQWRALGDGYRVETRIVVWEGAGVLKVPASAVFRHDGAWAVYVLDKDRARLTTVELGQRTASEVEVKSGLADGARVVVHPSDRVRDGVLVAPR